MNEGRPYLQMWRGVWVPVCKIAIVPSYLSDINRTAYIAGWQAHHHHQLIYTVLKITMFFIITSKMPVRCTEHQDAFV